MIRRTFYAEDEIEAAALEQALARISRSAAGWWKGVARQRSASV